MIDLFKKHRAGGGGPVTARQLLTGDYAKGQYAHLQPQLQLSADDFMEEPHLENEDSLLENDSPRCSRLRPRSESGPLEYCYVLVYGRRFGRVHSDLHA